MAYINLLSLWMRRQNRSGMDAEVLCNSAPVKSTNYMANVTNLRVLKMCG